MKQKLVIFILALTITGYAQQKSINLDLNYGISTPSSSFSNNSYAGDGSYIEFSPSFYFSKFGIGASLGQFTNPTEGNLFNETNSLTFPTTNASEDWKTSFYGIGPEYKTQLGDGFFATLKTRIGSMAMQSVLLNSSFNGGNADTTFPVYNFGLAEKKQTGYFSGGITLSYAISSQFSILANANYLSALSDKIEAIDSRRIIQDINKNGEIDAEDFFSNGVEPRFEEKSVFIKPQTTNFGIGLSYSFGKKPSTSKDSAPKSQTNPYFVSNEMTGEMESIKNSGSVTFTNPSKKDSKQEQKIVGILPKNNSIFNNADDIKNFSWEVIGAKILKPQFFIEVTKINSNQQPQRTYYEKTAKTEINASQIFKDNKLSEGQYRWKVTETTTGNSSEAMFFTISNCEIEFSITNEEIECLGYEGENRKFKICFDSTYSSISGDLTFSNPGSGLTVFDQTYAPLSYTLVSPNPMLLTQVGASTTTVSYCFEVVVGSGVTSIGFGLQGDDLDPSPILCQPGVSQVFDELPDCICDECEEIELSFDNFSISLNGTSGNQFNFDGEINVNVPIYGIEFQIQSYSYTANPSACTAGVSSVEESGMFLMPGTTINGSTLLQLANETVSGSPSSNNNATKNIKYTSNAALTGAIPVNLTIGLPGPLSGLDPSCCEINYTVCIKVKVFYDESNCKSCEFTHCFTFNNQ
jgi:hypothetical protein